MLLSLKRVLRCWDPFQLVDDAMYMGVDRYSLTNPKRCLLCQVTYFARNTAKSLQGKAQTANQS